MFAGVYFVKIYSPSNSFLVIILCPLTVVFYSAAVLKISGHNIFQHFPLFLKKNCISVQMLCLGANKPEFFQHVVSKQQISVKIL